MEARGTTYTLTPHEFSNGYFGEIAIHAFFEPFFVFRHRSLSTLISNRSILVHL